MMVAEGPIVIDGHILAIAHSVTVSFQRYPEDMFRGAAEVPRSYGALPLELSSPRHGFLPGRQGEGIWLGLSPQGRQGCKVRVHWLGTYGSEDAPLPWSATLSSLQRLHGLHKPDGSFCPFIRVPLSRDLIPCAGVVISVEDTEAIQVRFVSVPDFEAHTGRSAPRPISPEDCYGGWLLP
jgi:hypothetical protein